ncbi:MAG: metal-dependent hydrolase [Fimbriiglobus sp.]
MAGFRMHITVSTICGIGFGAAIKPLGYDPETCFLAAGVTAAGGMLPDLDSDSGIPVRELSGLAAAVLPMLAVPRLTNAGLSHEGVIITIAVLYFCIRYVLPLFLARFTVHRGMFHSVPAMVIAGLIVFLEYHSNNIRIRLVLGTAVMVGFLSHLILDEIYSVDFNGVRLRLSKSAGSALKFFSPSALGTITCYVLLALLAWVAYQDTKDILGL